MAFPAQPSQRCLRGLLTVVVDNVEPLIGAQCSVNYSLGDRYSQMGAKRVGPDLSCGAEFDGEKVSALQNIQEVRLSVKDSGIITLVGATPFRLRRQPHMDQAKPARPASQAAKNPTEAESSVELLARARAGD